ncbi:MAG TPA: OmpA family protein [Pyrinomonadaceae bacterium]|jgi:outer membrane protein OmpA-like peptidoglycan-associated protein|nr:OmpA family protein [Pyrinomonadaceae bacterium]
MSPQQKALVFSVLTLALVLQCAPRVFAQDQTSGTANQDSSTASARAVTSGQKMKIKGVVVRRDADTFTVRDINNVDTVVRLTNGTDVTERKSNPFRRAKNYATTSILRGLNVEVEGRGDQGGQLVADKVKFSDTEYRVARSIEARVNPVESRVGTAEGRLSQVEQNAQRLSGQLDELTAVANASRGGAKAAQETADAAIAGVNATNTRISALDDYSVQQVTTVNFKVGSSVLSPEAKQQLDTMAQQISGAKNFMVEVTGFTDSTGSVDLNRRLSQRRADAVVRYLAENHNVPLRRMITPFGYGEMQAVAENTSRDGRAQNRRVEVKMLINRGLTQQAPAMQSSGAQTNQ